MSCIRLLFFCLSLPVFPIHTQDQEIMKNYTIQHACPLTNIDDSSGLEAIANAIGDARIVMLGEQDHGDAPTFRAKTKLIEYLHRKKGFNVLAFEADFFSLNYSWPFVKDGRENIDTFFRRNITVYWSQCPACQELLTRYIPACLKDSKPLDITGFDNMMSTTLLLPVLDSVCRSLKIPITLSSAYDKEIFPLLSTWWKFTADSITNKKIRNYLTEIREQMLTKLTQDDFWVRAVDNLIQECVLYNNWKKDYWKDMNTRDHQMGLNLKWLSQVKYPNDKIIVWAHSYHVSKYSGHFPEEFLNKAVTMGTVFTDDPALMKETYILGFSSYEGKAGRIHEAQYKIRPPEKNSFENWVNKKYDYAFMDFKAFNAENPGYKDAFFMSGALKGNRYHDSQLALWNKVFDGVYFIREMYPCEDISPSPRP